MGGRVLARYVPPPSALMKMPLPTSKLPMVYGQAAPALSSAKYKGKSGWGSAFFGKDNLAYYTGANPTLGVKNRGFFHMPSSDAESVTDASSAAKETGMAPSALKAYKEGGDVYHLDFPVEHGDTREPDEADARGWPHFLPGGKTAVATGDPKTDPKAGYLINDTRERVLEGGKPMPKGSKLYKLGAKGERHPFMSF